MDTLRDESLMGMFSNGKPEAFQVLFERHKDKVFRFIHAAYMKDRAKAEDSTQDVFMRVIQHRDRFNRDMRFTTWLYTIARNHCLNQIRKARPIDMKTDEWEESRVYAPNTNAAETVEEKELGHKIQSAIHALPETPRAVFVLREIEGLSYPDISDILDLQEGNLRTQLHRAKKHLRETIAPYLEDTDGY